MSLLANHGMLGKMIPTIIQSEGDSATATTVTFTFDATPNDGNLIMLFYNTVSGAPSTLPGGLTLWYSLDNNGLGMYVYTKIASSETNSYIFGNATSDFKGVCGVCLPGNVTLELKEQFDNGAVNTTSCHLPSAGTENYAGNSLTLGYVVLLANRVITRTPLTALATPPTDGAAGNFKAMLAYRNNPIPIAYQILFEWGSGTRNKAISIQVT